MKLKIAKMITTFINHTHMTTIFSKIIAKEIPSDIVYEDENYLTFKDINPRKNTHLLIIPKKEIISFHTAQSEEDRAIVK